MRLEILRWKPPVRFPRAFHVSLRLTDLRPVQAGRQAHCRGKNEVIMTDLYQRIVGQRSGLESIMAKVPGYRGYKEASDRRAADRMIREHVVTLLKEQMNRLVNAEKKLMSSIGLSAAGKV